MLHHHTTNLAERAWDVAEGDANRQVDEASELLWYGQHIRLPLRLYDKYVQEFITIEVEEKEGNCE